MYVYTLISLVPAGRISKSMNCLFSDSKLVSSVVEFNLNSSAVADIASVDVCTFYKSVNSGYRY